MSFRERENLSASRGISLPNLCTSFDQQRYEIRTEYALVVTDLALAHGIVVLIS
jgi:hypothetical protein